MEVIQLQRRYLQYAGFLFDRGFLDGQFREVQQLQNQSNPFFVVEVVSTFFQDSRRIINDLTRALDEENVDFGRVNGYLIQLRGISSSIGAGRVRSACMGFHYSCEEQNIEACLRWRLVVKGEYLLLKKKLRKLLRLERRIVEAGGVVPRLDF